jgi:hypothetical protein
MIKQLTGVRGITVVGGNSSYPYVNMSNSSAGMVRYNGNNQNFEVYDGSSWITFSGNYTTIELDTDARALSEWVRAKRAEEEYLNKQAESNPAIKDLINQRNDIDSKITMVKTLLKSHNQNESESEQSSP